MIKQLYNKYHVMIYNFSYLVLLRGLTLVVPLLTYPYLIRVLGTNNYGLVMWAWAIAELFIVFIKFGFDTLGIKLISENRDNKMEVSKIFSQIIYIKIGLFIFSMLIFLLLTINIDKIANHHDLFLYFIAFIFFESMFPVWYFQGIENMKIMAILVSLIKLSFALLVFIFIHNETDYIKVPILYALGSMIANGIAYFLIYKHNIKFTSIKVLLSSLPILKESFYILFSTIGTVLRDRVTIILIEKYLGLSSVAYFDLALKIINILLTPFHIVSQVIYPHIARTKDMIFLKKVILRLLSISIFIVAIFHYNLEQIVLLVNGCFSQDLFDLMGMLIFIVPIGLLSLLIGDNILVVYGFAIHTLYSMIFAVIGYSILYLLLGHNTTYNFAILFISYFIFELLSRVFSAKLILQRKKNA